MKRLFDYFREIEFDRYKLRKITLDDAKDIFDIYGDKDVMKYDHQNLIESLDKTDENISMVHKGFDNKWFIRWGLVNRDTNELIGTVALHHFEFDKDKVQIGYNLKKAYWKQGIMSEVLELTIDYLSKNTSINELEASIDSGNTASIRLAEKLGFKLKEEPEGKVILSKELNQVRKIEVVEHNPKWKDEYSSEAKKISEIMNDEIVGIYHIGSTSIEGIYAKPIIDILVGVKDISKIDKYNSEMEQLGYKPMGEYGIEERRFYLKGIVNRTHHVHIFEIDSHHIARHLNFRDYMNTHPEDAKCYEELKKELAKKYRYDNEGYCDGKDDFIKEIDKKAELWSKIR